MRKRGYNVTARPATKNHYLSRHPEEAWADPDIKTASGTGLDDIISTAKNWPENARAEMSVRRSPVQWPRQGRAGTAVLCNRTAALPALCFLTGY